MCYDLVSILGSLGVDVISLGILKTLVNLIEKYDLGIFPKIFFQV